MKYICEICHQQFNTAPEAEDCELAHQKAKRNAEVKDAASEKISDAINAYIAKFKEFPEFNISEDNLGIVIGSLAENVEDAFKSLATIMSMLTLDDAIDCDDCDCEDCDEHCSICDR